MSHPLDEDPVPGIITAVRVAMAGPEVMGERPADLTDHLPCVVLSRRGGLELESAQDAIADQPLIAADCYAMGLPAARALAQQARKALRGIGARPFSGPFPASDAQESAGVRRVNVVYRITVR